MLMEDKSANWANRGVLDPCLWISFPVDPRNDLTGGTCVMTLGQDDKHNLGEFVNIFPYDGKFLRVYNPLEGPTLRMGKSSSVMHFLYYLFAYDAIHDLVYCASYKGRSCLLREGEVYPKCIMLSWCVPYCDAMSVWIIEPSYDLAYRNTLDDPNVHDTFLYYLFACDVSHTCLRCALHMGQSFIEVYTYLYDPIMWFFYHFDPGECLGVDELVVVPFLGWYYPFDLRHRQFPCAPSTGLVMIMEDIWLSLRLSLLGVILFVLTLILTLIL